MYTLKYFIVDLKLKYHEFVNLPKKSIPAAQSCHVMPPYITVMPRDAALHHSHAT